MPICEVEQLVGYNKPDLIQLLPKMTKSLIGNFKKFDFVSNRVVQIAEKCYGSESPNLFLFMLYRCFAYSIARQFQVVKIMV